MDNNNASSTNTTLIVIVLLLLVGFGVWWFTMRGGVDAPNVEVNTPAI